MPSSSPTPLIMRVKSVTWETDAINAYDLRPIEARELPAFTAGAHVTVHLPNGLQRSYSLMNSPQERHRYVLGIAHDRNSRGGSRYIHEHIRPGAVLSVDPPKNLFPLTENAARSILIGGGIGVTPMLSMAARLTQIDADWTLYYAARSANDAAFRETLSGYGDRVWLHKDDEAGGLLDIAAIVASAAPGTHFYCCGPEPMLAAFNTAAAGLQSEQVHIERFAPAEEAATDGGFVVELARAGKTIPVARGQTILEALRDAGVSAPSSCRQGVCGACETAVLSGVPDHRDAVLSEAERSANNTMMICCSGAKSERLVLDL